MNGSGGGLTNNIFRNDAFASNNNQEDEIQGAQYYENIILQITQMGFQRRQAEAAMEAVMVPDISMLVDYIDQHPEAGLNAPQQDIPHFYHSGMGHHAMWQ